MHLSQLYIHPLKSGRGIEYSQAYASHQGLLHDREWLLTHPDGRFITARDYPQLVRVQMDLMPGAVLFKAPGKSPIAAIASAYTRPAATQVWKDSFSAWHGDDTVDAWFSDYLGTPCRLLWLGLRSARPQKSGEHGLSFADGYPYLIVNQASLDELNRQLPRPVTLRHFRPNLVIEGAYPFEEDEWKVLRVGALEFELVKPCTRCILTTVDPDSGEKSEDREPMTTLMRTRRLPEGVCFGVNAVLRGEGLLHVGDAVEVLESKLEF